MALGYEESRLEQQVVSGAGAVGLMQVKPNTARAMGISDIYKAVPNVLAGTKLLAYLMDIYLEDASLDEQNRT